MEFNFSFTEGTLKDIEEKISTKLNSLGLMFRIFSRNKNPYSLSHKINSDSRYGTVKKIQDAIGIRVVLYFNDDIAIAHKAISSFMAERSQDHSISTMNTQEFSAVRYNIVYEIPSSLMISNQAYKNNENYIDSTFELQFRTVLSEGWHEVEHDLRYKSREDWHESDAESRKLNGIYATLETSEWTMVKIFDELAYKHYKNKNWEAMLRQKLRVRLSGANLDEKILNIFDENIDIAKRFYRLPRNEILMNMSDKNYSLPITLNSIVYFCNLFHLKNELISNITPNVFVEEFEDLQNTH